MNRINEKAMKEHSRPDAPGGKHSTPEQTGESKSELPWDERGSGSGKASVDSPRKASGVAKSGDRKPDQDNEDDLEDALEQTFPASDPVSSEQIVKPGKPPNRDR